MTSLHKVEVLVGLWTVADIHASQKSKIQKHQIMENDIDHGFELMVILMMKITSKVIDS